MSFLRLTAQTYCLLKNLLGPLVTTMKALASRSCELATVDEMELDLSQRDPEFVTLAKKFLLNLRNIKTSNRLTELGFQRILS